MIQGLYTSLSGLRSSRLAIEVIGDNIANVNTDGYQKREYRAKENYSIIKNSNNIGTGVSSYPIKRSHNEIMFSKMKNSLSLLSEDKAYKDGINFLNKLVLENIDKKNDINSLINNMYNSIEEISKNPNNKSIHEIFKSNLKLILDRADYLDKTLDKTLDKMISNIDLSINSKRDEINQNLKEFDLLTEKISIYESANDMNIKNRYMNDLRDRRDLIEERLSELSSFRVQKTKYSNGRINITDTGNRIYSRSSYETSGEIKGLKDLKDTIIDLKNTFNKDFSKFKRNINNIYIKYGNENLIIDNKVTDNELFFSKENNLGDNTIALDLLKLRDKNSFDMNFKNIIFSENTKINSNYLYTESLFNIYKENNDSVSKVNIDTETINLINYQRAYEANAKVIKTINEILKTTINLKN